MTNTKGKYFKNQVFASCLAVAILFFTMLARADELPSPSTNKLNLKGIELAVNSVTNRLHQIAPHAEMHWNDKSSGYYQIVLKQNADKAYKVHIPSLGKKRPPREVNTRGPASDGFSIQIRFREGKYNEAMVRPVEPSFAKPSDGLKPHFFSETVLTKFPDQNIYMVTDIQYGTEMDTNVVSRVFHVLKSTISDSIASVHSESK